MSKKILLVCGSRAQTIQLAPIAAQARNLGLSAKIVVVQQQGKNENVQDILSLFSLHADYEICSEVSELLFCENPSAVLIHGTSSVAFSSSISALLQNVPVGVVGGGHLSSGEPDENAFEMQDKFILATARWHFVAAASARRNLICEGVNSLTISQSGSPAVDTALEAYEQLSDNFGNEQTTLPVMKLLKPEIAAKVRLGQFVVVALQSGKCNFTSFPHFVHSLERISQVRPDLPIVVLSDEEGFRRYSSEYGSLSSKIVVLRPLDILSEFYLVSRSRLVITNSARLLEEAPVFGKHVLIAADQSDRTELIDSKIAKCVGQDASRLVASTLELLAVHRPLPLPQFGNDGMAAKRIARILMKEVKTTADISGAPEKLNENMSCLLASASIPLRVQVG